MYPNNCNSRENVVSVVSNIKSFYCIYGDGEINFGSTREDIHYRSAVAAMWKESEH